ncbi:MAG: hypothetical protein LBC64_01750 [Fibromonadaceae bacterium]|jgi:hypothetical protein|nr:hypothetical protein [Fibromonadaceae bacterium]
MKSRYLRAILLILGIAGIVAFELYPTEKHEECFDKDSMDFYPYGNHGSGAAYVEVKPLAFKCKLSKEDGHCGIGFSFDEKKNWNLMDYLVLDLHSSADLKELIVSVQTFDPSHTKDGDRSSLKPVMKELKLTGKKRYELSMNQFYTPDYWFEQQGARYINNPKRFSLVNGLELFAGWKNPANTEFELKIESVCVEGYGNMPFIILVAYIGILIMAAISIRTKHTE